MCNKFRIEEFVVSKLSVVTLVFNSILVDLLQWKLKIKSPKFL